jgi:hypothetical protein
MVVPCIVNMRLKTCGDTKLLCECKLDTDDERLDPTHREEEQRVNDVQNPESFMIHRRQPFVERINPWPACDLHIRNDYRI